jgi:prolipoprotein diacylglyceryltransferase
VQLYDLGLALVGFALAWRIADGSRRRWVFPFAVAWLAASRFATEFLRGDQGASALSASQVVEGAALVALALAVLAWGRRWTAWSGAAAAA